MSVNYRCIDLQFFEMLFFSKKIQDLLMVAGSAALGPEEGLLDESVTCHTLSSGSSHVPPKAVQNLSPKPLNLHSPMFPPFRKQIESQKEANEASIRIFRRHLSI